MVETLTPSMKPVVGRHYLVPCIRLPLTAAESHHRYRHHSASDADGWVPVIGPQHQDRETLDFEPMHFHVDVRFLSDTVLRSFEGHRTGMPPEAAAMLLPVSTWSDGIGGAPFNVEMARVLRQCIREMPSFPSAARLAGPKSAARWALFERNHAACKLKPGNICPHRGIDLTPFIKADGTVICPGHGLRWNTLTGELLPHHATTEPQP